MNKLKKLSFIERCVYFFDLLAYERRLQVVEREINEKKAMLEQMLIDVVDENVTEERLLDIYAHIGYLKNKQKKLMAMFDLTKLK